MTTLQNPEVSAVLDHLFAETEAHPPAWQTLPPDLLDLTTSKTGYRDFYTAVKHLPLPVSRETGMLLYLLARATQARTILEFGTSFGVSTLYLAAALRDNGGGMVITTEFEPSKAERARQNFVCAGLADLIDLREGDALQTLARDVPATLDLVLLDGAKALYAEVLTLVEQRLRPGTLVVADDADMCPEYLARVRSAPDLFLSLPFAEDVELTLCLN